MTDHERGAYAPPTDGPLTFDARQPVRGGRPAPLSLILSILVLAGVVAALFLFYRQGVRQSGQAPQTVGVPVAGLKTPAPAEAQPTDPAAGLQIYRSEAGGPVETVPPPPKFTPPPEEPTARTAPVQVVTAPPAAAPETPTLRPSLPAELPPAPKVVAPAPKAAAPAPPVKVAAAPPPKTAAKPAPKTPTGVAVVQIGAVGSTALADKAWKDAMAAAGGLAAGKGKSVQKIEKGGGVLYRTAVTGFASKEAAQAFCAKLKGAGKSCFVR